ADVPTMIESGYPGFEVQSWRGLYVPAKTPRRVIDMLHDQTVKVIQIPEVREGCPRTHRLVPQNAPSPRVSGERAGVRGNGFLHAFICQTNTFTRPLTLALSPKGGEGIVLFTSN